MLFKKICCLVIAWIILVFSSALAAEKSWPDVVNEIEGLLNAGRDAYAHGRSEEAKEFISDAYFTAFEGEGMETAISIYISSERGYELESMFGNIRKAIHAKAPVSEV